MLGDASSNVHMQYLREGVLMTEAEENKLHQTSFIKVTSKRRNRRKRRLDLQEEAEYPMLAAKDGWTESRDNLHDHPTNGPSAAAGTSSIPTQNLVADNEVITKPRHAG